MPSEFRTGQSFAGSCRSKGLEHRPFFELLFEDKFEVLCAQLLFDVAVKPGISPCRACGRQQCRLILQEQSNWTSKCYNFVSHLTFPVRNAVLRAWIECTPFTVAPRLFLAYSSFVRHVCQMKPPGQ